MPDPVTRITPLQSTPDQVTVTFSGDEALQVLRDLQRRLAAESPEEVVLRGVQLLVSAVDKEVLLRRGNHTEVVRLWPQ